MTEKQSSSPWVRIHRSDPSLNSPQKLRSFFDDILAFPDKIRFEVVETGMGYTIQPLGDVTASSVQRFVKLIFDLRDKGHTEICFDMRYVFDIDNTSLDMFASVGRMFREEAGHEIQMTNLNPHVLHRLIESGVFRLYRY